ncbi:hypothetical protein GQ54DRAFT_254962 [Martensiomyces pterosporus]|nr:hypothetical protein GQ54DRAFT_254962 [Martensiomyces pterosporus]
MSLADLYKNDHDLGEDSEEEEEEEYVPGGIDADGNEAEDDRDNEAKREPTEHEKEGQKRKIDSIWEEMNRPIDLRSKSLKTAAGSSTSKTDGERTAVAPEQSEQENASEPQKKETEGVSASKSDSVDTESNTGAQQQQAPLRRGPKRRASKFSKIAEQVEQRRVAKENTLEKARKEWTSFVSAEGIREDLDKANKDGFIERQGFLSRVNERTYERSRERQK